MNSDAQHVKGLVIVHTGNGKGKTTAALGIVFRALGRGLKCGVVQFLKGKWETGERMFAKTVPELDFYVMGLGFTWDSDDLDKDKLAAQAAWSVSCKMIIEGNHNIIILDEITYAFHYGWLNAREVVDILAKRPKNVHVVITGRNCPEILTDYADLVSVTQVQKHPYQNGIPAQKGIDF
ncbi:cob(I)yrinic acid a,c-diamide adenosyltransferase [Leptospira weilii serovar Ranarum str. ICFT]|uniref:corrinoid adenosyltransferase n=1 Tax=Leptospira weilii serovar Ranarum str. ICFT TaxID=1218598 RepID=N1WRT3_9LEPT|nr:cob(I)yrinic acid a,c-diamide adenosyltransferase [Leptospira weilii]EMY78533.1 cob(I)yrinic acid a,c-diamide adenosyltransferase [Leptospira weilii serovar Ranarum str. ICFT]